MPHAALADPRAAVQAIARRSSEPAWSLEVRERALQAYLDSSLPDRVQHLWRYTDPAPFAPADLSPPSAAAENQGTAGEREPGVRVLGLAEALRSEPDLVRAHLGKLVGDHASSEGSGKFEALNLAAWTAGTLVHVARNVRVEKPIHLLQAFPRPQAPEAFLATRILLVVEEGAEVTLIDECEGGGPGLKLSSAVEVFAAGAARVRYVAVQRLDKSVVYHVAQRANVARDAHLLTAIASLGGGVTKSDFGSYLTGPGSNVELVGFLFGEGRQHFDHHTLHDHRAGKSWSNLDFRVVLKDRSRSTYTGLIRIEPGCPDSEAYQENRNLLLNEGTRAESIPELEILTDEVKCTHGATMGTLDAQHLFYLMSRGIDRAEAVRLIVSGFVEPTLARLDPDLRERLRAHVEERVRGL
ncbi:MAG: Fe-S cluster assembly protein SufD [Planctomycetes bacterium]|nr:Fe-S cluster assembly protein SufD [Planctomycetota bacterium]